MNFRDAVLSQMPAAKRSKAEAKSGPVRRRMWAAAENVARHRIEQKTGQKLVGTIDWAKWLELLKELMPIILKLLALFGV